MNPGHQGLSLATSFLRRAGALRDWWGFRRAVAVAVLVVAMQAAPASAQTLGGSCTAAIYSPDQISVVQNNIVVCNGSLWQNLIGAPAADPTYSIAIGANSLYSDTSGTDNTALGYQAGYDLTSGAQNIMIGYYPTTGVGITTGSNNILIGQNLQELTKTSSNQLDIGNLIFATGLASGSTMSTGSVGIGTTAPSTNLQIKTTKYSDTNVLSLFTSDGSYFGTATGSLRINPAASSGLSEIATVNAAGFNIDANYNSSGSSNSLFKMTPSGISFTGTSGAPGNVGIGTASPAANLTVVGSSHAAGYAGSSADFLLTTGTGAATDNQLEFGIYDGNYSWIQATQPGTAYRNLVLNNYGGFVGIGGNASPAVRLDVAGSVATAAIGTEDEFHLTRLLNAANSHPQVASFLLGSYAVNNSSNGYGPSTRLDINLKAAANDTLSGDTNVMTLLSNGYVGIGTTSATGILDVVGGTAAASTSGTNITITAQNGGTGSTNGGSILLNVGSKSGSGTTGTVQISGAASGPAFMTTSDARIKTNITPLENGLAGIAALEGVTYTYRPPAEREVGKDLSLPVDKRQMGVIAQNVEQVFPEAVESMEATGIKTVNYNALIAPMIEAIKSQQEEINALIAVIALLCAGLAGAFIMHMRQAQGF